MIVRDIDVLNMDTRRLCYAQQSLILKHNLPFKIFETLRSAERQAECYANGSSKKKYSNHQSGDAWDVALWLRGADDVHRWAWDPIFWYQVLGILTLSIIPGIKWGADWNGRNFWYDEEFRDYGHFERII